MGNIVMAVPYYHIAVWSISLFAMFVHAQVVVTGGFVSYQAVRAKKLFAARDVLGVVGLSMMFLVIQALWMRTDVYSEGYLELAWKLFDALVGVMLLRHVQVRRCFVCDVWGRGRERPEK